jgi:hypothetical protein
VMGSALLLGRARGDRPRRFGAPAERPGHPDRFGAGGKYRSRGRVWPPAGAVTDLESTRRDQPDRARRLVGLGTSDNLTTDCGMCMRGGIYVPYQHTQAVHFFVSPDSFAAGGARIVSGRGLTDEDRIGGARVAGGEPTPCPPLLPAWRGGGTEDLARLRSSARAVRGGGHCR